MKVEKIPIPLADDPVEAPVRQVTEKEVGAQVRLLHNLIVPTPDGKSKLIPRGEIVPFADVPERLRVSEFIEGVDAFREGKVMLLHDMVCAVPNFDGQRTVWREKLFSAYSLVDLTTIPNRIVEGMTEGTDYLTKWDEAERKTKEHERQNARKCSRWKSRMLRSASLETDRGPMTRYDQHLA
jgi:hypothetical protein